MVPTAPLSDAGGPLSPAAMKPPPFEEEIPLSPAARKHPVLPEFEEEDGGAIATLEPPVVAGKVSKIVSGAPVRSESEVGDEDPAPTPALKVIDMAMRTVLGRAFDEHRTAGEVLDELHDKMATERLQFLADVGRVCAEAGYEVDFDGDGSKALQRARIIGEDGLTPVGGHVGWLPPRLVGVLLHPIGWDGEELRQDEVEADTPRTIRLPIGTAEDDTPEDLELPEANFPPKLERMYGELPEAVVTISLPGTCFPLRWRKGCRECSSPKMVWNEDLGEWEEQDRAQPPWDPDQQMTFSIKIRLEVIHSVLRFAVLIDGGRPPNVVDWAYLPNEHAMEKNPDMIW